MVETFLRTWPYRLRRLLGTPTPEERTLLGRLRSVAFHKQVDEFKGWLAAHEKNRTLIADFLTHNRSADVSKFDGSARHNTVTTEEHLANALGGAKEIRYLTVQLPDPAQGQIPVHVRDKRINFVTVRKSRPVIFSNCWIQVLRITDDARVTFKGTFIDEAHFEQCEDLHIEGGCLFRTYARPYADRDTKNPFRARVTIKSVYIPRERDYLDFLKRDPELAEQWRAFRVYEFRNIRNFLTSGNELLAAGHFHAAELALERADDHWPSSLVNWLYERLSDYGNSSRRPFIWALLSLSALGVAAYFADSVTVIIPQPHPDLHIWQQTLAENRLLRAVVFPFYAVFNPLNVFTSRPFMVSKEWYWLFLHSLISLFGTLNVALLVLALRRRFKLD